MCEGSYSLVDLGAERKWPSWRVSRLKAVPYYASITDRHFRFIILS